LEVYSEEVVSLVREDIKNEVKSWHKILKKEDCGGKRRKWRTFHLSTNLKRKRIKS
jgi:hypothetical protein